MGQKDCINCGKPIVKGNLPELIWGNGLCSLDCHDEFIGNLRKLLSKLSMDDLREIGNEIGFDVDTGQPK